MAGRGCCAQILWVALVLGVAGGAWASVEIKDDNLTQQGFAHTLVGDFVKLDETTYQIPAGGCEALAAEVHFGAAQDCGDAGFTFNSTTDTVTIGENGQDGSLIIYSEQGATDYTTKFQPGTQTQNVTYTLPPDDGTSGQLLRTGGTGTLTWVTACPVGSDTWLQFMGDDGVTCEADKNFIVDNDLGQGELGVGSSPSASVFAPPTPRTRITVNTTETAQANNVTSLTWTHTGSGSNTMLVVSVLVKDTSGSARAPTTVTIAGSAMTKLVEKDNNTSGNVSLWYKLAAANGSVVATWAAEMDAVAGTSTKIANVLQAAPTIFNSSATTSTSLSFAIGAAVPPGAYALGAALMADDSGTGILTDEGYTGGTQNVETFNLQNVGFFYAAGEFAAQNHVAGTTVDNPLTLTWQIPYADAGSKPFVGAYLVVEPVGGNVYWPSNSGSPQWPDLSFGTGGRVRARLRLGYLDRGHNLFSFGRRVSNDGILEYLTDHEGEQVLRVNQTASGGSISLSTKRKPRAGYTRLNWISPPTSEKGGWAVASAWAPAASTTLSTTEHSIFQNASTPIMLDATSSGSATASATLTVSHVVGSGSNRALIVATAATSSTATESQVFATGVTYGGTALTKADGIRLKGNAGGGGNSQGSEHWYLIAPASGAADIVVTWPVAVNGRLAALSLTGVKQTGQPEATNTSGEVNAGVWVDVTTTTANAWVVGSIYRVDDVNLNIEIEKANAYFGGAVGINQEHPRTLLDVNGGVSFHVQAITASYEASAYDATILADATAGALTVTLPPATQRGQVIHVEKTDASGNAVTVARAGADTIEGATTHALAAQYNGATYIADGTSVWYIE